MMGVLWFSIFILLSALLRKLRFPIRYSAAPLLGLLILSLFRMLFIFTVPGAAVITSKVVYPAIVNALMGEVALGVTVLNLLIFIWTLVSVTLLIRLLFRNIKNYISLMSFSIFRDIDAETVLAEIIAPHRLPRRLRVYRTGSIKVPVVAGISRVRVFLPEMDFSPEELRGILAHEWKHYRDKDSLVTIVIQVICLVFWWNPLVYLLKRNVSLALELKSDYAAVKAMDGNVQEYLESLLRIVESLDTEENVEPLPDVAHALASSDDEVLDRFLTLSLSKIGKPHRRQKSATLIFCVAMAALFAFSFLFIIQPFYSPDVDVIPEEEAEDVHIVDNTYAVDNGDGTYSIYSDGEYMWDLDDADDLIPFLSKRVPN